ncbi:uncharacterized protein TRIADDRAFT_58997 [Trichoplax adhaerens]|uniref:B30.2/SPRY domain-containing protein n=1 Tax=Trichoplax adhaerens TaxID=10228 RepID=B3S489_TRIAD|nr:hypothetical protein TRIADDRAFT_58997 [Trichoplax adhaerens]EDV22602.1 hypothetical protein TRIADDRAFT_58997 [Trichoplax adhaerens]|eukprot:XP_002115146.1 hypothetical protein TRIADDRAFT_58997 [Trichoplax adhaerens]
MALEGEDLTDTERKDEKQRSQKDSDINSKCYCGLERLKDGTTVEFQCVDCRCWFHAKCTEFTSDKLIPYLTNYEYLCKRCSTDNNERFELKTARLVQVCVTALANLMTARPDSEEMFCKEKDIVPFVQEHWITIFINRAKTSSWHGNLNKVLIKEKDFFICNQTTNDSGKPVVYARLKSDVELSTISPLLFDSKSSLMVYSKNYYPSEDLVKEKYGHKRGKESGGGRRKGETLHSQSASKKSRTDITSAQKELPAHGYPLEHPFNKDGYRYILAEKDPLAKVDDVDPDVWLGKKPLPARIYRAVSAPAVYVSLNDRAQLLKVSDDRLTVTGYKGYAVARATHGVTEGAWYFEVTVDDLRNGEAAVRLGWSQLFGNLQAPLGYDKFSYSWRNRKGTRFHQSRGKSFSDSFSEGDVLGFYIYLPRKEDGTLLPENYKDKVLITFKGFCYYEVRDNATEAEKKLKELPSSKIILYKNGIRQGVAWENIFEGTYYPAVSIYKFAQVTLNFGPNFKFPPPDVEYQPISDLATIAVAKQCLADLAFHVDYAVEPKQPESIYVLNNNSTVKEN